jgi:hypothetical protein
MNVNHLNPQTVAEAKAYYRNSGCSLTLLRKKFKLSHYIAFAITNNVMTEYDKATKIKKSLAAPAANIKPRKTARIRWGTPAEITQVLLAKDEIIKGYKQITTAKLSSLATRARSSVFLTTDNRQPTTASKPHRPKNKTRNTTRGLREMELLLTIHGIPFQKTDAKDNHMRIHFTIPHKKIAIQYAPRKSRAKKPPRRGGLVGPGRGWKILRYTLTTYNKLIERIKRVL